MGTVSLIAWIKLLQRRIDMARFPNLIEITELRIRRLFKSDPHLHSNNEAFEKYK